MPEDETDSGSAPATGGDDDAGTSGTPPDDGATFDGDAGEESTGGEVACTEFLGSGPGTAVEFTVVNGTAAAIYLDWTWGLAPMALEGPSGLVGWFAWGTTCDRIVGAGADSFCGEGYPVPQVTRIDPGASYAFTWSGMSYDTVDIPLDCVHPDDAEEWPCFYQETCGIPQAPAAGTYNVELTAFPGVAAGEAGPLTDCEGEACVISDAFTDGEPFAASVDFDYPNAAVTVTF